ncbi:hypothetical protein VCHA29O37_500015 [Vibrio chagasii]|nr:hypothetical protein VCHA29O37_500015 [Vibrio chagasii]
MANKPRAPNQILPQAFQIKNVCFQHPAFTIDIKLVKNDKGHSFVFQMNALC